MAGQTHIRVHAQAQKGRRSGADNTGGEAGQTAIDSGEREARGR